ncbi:MAG: GreA/GreB family elongation factor, partial [Candidatus Dormibacteraeota bacterium]|nr:GreA/GreB family elongation factor [Candidatus Dormibacteraeota bacterium]
MSAEMDEKPVFLTKEGLRQLEDELEQLVNVRRPEVAERIRHARDFGDIAENAEYTEAKNEQSLVEGRIQTVEGMIHNAAVIEEEPRQKGVVSVGAVVEVSSEEGKETYTIVGPAEADPLHGRISN